MTLLNRRSEEHISEPPDNTALDEAPPGLEAIRAWLRKPRPWLRGILLWVRWIVRRVRRGISWAAANAVPAARRTVRMAARGADAARELARTSRTAAQIGRRLADIGRDWRNAGGHPGRVGARLASAAGRFRDFSSRVARTASHGVAIGEGINDLGSVLGDLRKPDPAPAEKPPPSPPARRLVPPRPPKQRETLPAPSPKPETAPHSEGAAAPRPARVKPSKETSGAPSPAPVAISDRRAAALEELPWPLRAGIRALSDKPLPDVLRPLIVEVLRVRGWTTSAELALLFDLDARSLKRRHLGPLVEGGVLKLRYPDRTTHPRQAYRVRSADSPPPGGTGARR